MECTRFVLRSQPHSRLCLPKTSSSAIGAAAFRSSPRFTLVERKTQLTKIIKLPRATARATQKAAARRLKPIGDFVHTITFDNGKEFAAHQDIASVKGRTDPCYSKISLRFSSNSALSISPLAKVKPQALRRDALSGDRSSTLVWSSPPSPTEAAK
ncbi:MAG: hypothetical protein WAR76_24855 [Xanthobacteraceae bacterium]